MGARSRGRRRDAHLGSDVGVEAGLSRFHAASGPVVWTLPERETLIVLECGARIEIADAPDARASSSRYRVAAGWRTNDLAPEPAFKELWVLRR